VNASNEGAEEVADVPGIHYQASRQHINLDKSLVFFSKGCQSGVLGTVCPWRNRDDIGLVLDKSKMDGPFGGKQALPILVEGGSSDSHILEVHGEGLQEMGGGWENKLPGDRGN
jgi:hypothetical protein